MSSYQHGVKESAVMENEASKSKEIKECAKELHFLINKMYSQFCEGELCTKCKLDIKNGECILNRMISVVNTLEKILYGEKIKL